MQSEPFDLRSRARYIGSLVKDEQLCDFYEIVIDGHIQYIYIRLVRSRRQTKIEGGSGRDRSFGSG